MKYNVGDEVRCLTDAEADSDGISKGLEKGNTYFVREARERQGSYDFEEVYYYENEDDDGTDLEWSQEFVENPANFELIPKTWRERYK